MELRDYLRVLRRGWVWVIAIIVLGVGAGVGITAGTSEVYQANVQVFVATSSGNSAADLSQGNIFAQDRVQSYTSIATSPAVTEAVIKDLGLRLTPAQLATKISADAPVNKVLINLHVTDHDPQEAATLANKVASAFRTAVQNTEQSGADGQSVVKLSVIQPATAPTAPIKPNRLLNIGLGLVLGLLVGVGVVILRDALDNTVKGPADFEELGVPVLGMVPFDKRAERSAVALREEPHSARSEAYRQLRTNFEFVNVDRVPRIIAVTSAVPAEGKTTTVLNLAAALAEAGHRVCVIEADLRRPTIGQKLGLVTDVGFTTALIGRTPVVDAMQNMGLNVAVLTSGVIPPNPTELLSSDHAREIIEEIASHVDYTIIDTAPLLPVADGLQIASMADATILVHRAGKTTRDQAQRCVAALEKVGKAPVGVVLNMVGRSSGQYDYYEYGYYGGAAAASKPKAGPSHLAPSTSGTPVGQSSDSSAGARA